jgi:hypothetical protein
VARWGRKLGLIAGFTALCSVSCSIAFGYYNFVYFTSRNAPFNPVPVRFDLNALTGGTVSYFISDQPPAALTPGDSYGAIVSQIRSAAAVWNGVSTSSLRLAYGGISAVGAPQTAPGIDVVFNDDMPVGLLAQTRITTPVDVTPFVGGGFVPLQRSTVQLRSDLTSAVGAVKGQPSYSELFYTTLVHEFGHALGLQHSLTSGAMATYVTRATTKGHPLTPDDVAAVSMLYPAGNFVASTGSINGRVSLGASGVNLASVVALGTNGAAISGLTNPDGSYSINGIPPGQYYVYVHPLPPAQQGEAYPDNIVPPVDLQNNAFPALTGFGTIFAPGTRDWTQASQFAIRAGAATTVNFSVQSSGGPAVYNLQTYVYQGAGGQVAVPSPYLVTGSRQYLVFTANGALVSGTTQLTAGLGVSAIGTAARMEPATLAYYQQGFLYEVIDAGPVTASSAVPVALAVTTNTDLYVLPAAVTVTTSPGPAVSAVTVLNQALGGATLNVVGTSLTPATQILFDGAAATVSQQNNDGSLTVTAPPAAGGYTAFVEAVNPDGQGSAMALGTAQPAVFTYPNLGNPAISVAAGTLIAGADQVVQIAGVNTNFVDGQAVAGFASSDIQVKRTWVVDGQHLWADVSVSPQTSFGPFTVSVENGLQLATQPGVLQVQAGTPQQISMRAPAVDASTGLAGVRAGNVAVISMTGMPGGTQSLAGWTLTIGGISATPVLAAPNQIRAIVPQGVAAGRPALVHLIPPSGDTIPQIAMQVDTAPPSVGNITGPNGAATVGIGDLVSVPVFGLSPDASLPVSASSVSVTVNDVPQTLIPLTALGQANSYMVQFILSGVSAGSDTLKLTIGTRQVAGTLIVHN